MISIAPAGERTGPGSRAGCAAGRSPGWRCWAKWRWAGADPVELYRCGDRYFVNDGHHRIAVARALGQREVWAEVTDVRAARGCRC
jgi:hypothetical protein